MKKRIEYIDAMRGFSIFLVVYSHILTYAFGSEFMIENFTFNQFFVIFRMPLFFFISGFILYKSTTIWTAVFSVDFLKKKFLIQIIPTIVFLLLYVYIFNYNLSGALLDSAKRGYWFTISLFEYFIIYSIFSFLSYKLKLSVKTRSLLLILTALFLLIFSMPTVNTGYLHLNKDVIGILGITQLKYFIFFAFGVLVRQSFHRFQQIIDNKYLFSFICVACLLITVFFVHHGLYANGLYNHLFLLVLGVLWITIIFAFFRKNERMFNQTHRFGKVMQFVGRRTLDIYLLHYFFLPRNMTFLRDFFVENNLPMVEFAISLLLATIVVALCLATSQLLRTSDFLAHYLFGAKLPPIANQKPTQPELAIHPINKDQEEELETKVS